jgi:transcriptional regulator with GAF, ATPase, and Fis domain
LVTFKRPNCDNLFNANPYMQAEVIVFSNATQPKSHQIRLSPFYCEQFKTIGENSAAALCLIEDKWLADLQKNSEEFSYRGVKHKKKSLTYYFRNSDNRILILSGCNYSDFSQLRRSINDFLNNAVRYKLHSLYFIVISTEFFIKAKEEASQTWSNNEAKKGKYLNPLLNMLNTVNTKVNLSERYIGNSEPCLLVRQMIASASRNDFPVLILGETGTGKEVVARNIHECSDRSNYPFISINCGAIPQELFESELFGYKKGSHSSAYSDKKGLWELADKSTLFLDEIGDLSLNHQVKILKALDDKEILPVGSLKKIKVDVRIIAATNKNIEVLANEKRNEFRDDLYYRISTFIIRTPSLLTHAEDIPELAGKIWEEICNKKLSSGVLNQLRYMNWPGNVRSLKHFLQRLYALFGTVPITEEHVQVLQHQDIENYLKTPQDSKNIRKLSGDKDFEKAIMKIEYLLKALLYTEDEDKRKELLENVKESLSEIY